MEQELPPDAADVLARGRPAPGLDPGVRNHHTAGGIAVLVWPGPTLVVVAVLFGIQLIATGIFRFVGALASDDLAARYTQLRTLMHASHGVHEVRALFPRRGLDVDRKDVKGYLDFVNEAIYDLLLVGQGTAKGNARDTIEPRDLPITQGLLETIHECDRIDEEIELRPILDSLAARPPLEYALTRGHAARLPVIFGGLSVALARTLKIIVPDLRRVHTVEWDRVFRILRPADIATGGQVPWGEQCAVYPAGRIAGAARAAAWFRPSNRGYPRLCCCAFPEQDHQRRDHTSRNGSWCGDSCRPAGGAVAHTTCRPVVADSRPGARGDASGTWFLPIPWTTAGETAVGGSDGSSSRHRSRYYQLGHRGDGSRKADRDPQRRGCPHHALGGGFHRPG